jgi:dihydrofolate reductase
MRITLIAALARNRVIGNEGALPWRLPDDLKHFKELTLGKPIVMGRATYDSIGKPLPGRRNLVLSTRASTIDGCTVVRSIDEALEAERDAEELCVIGGERVYASFLPIADRLELTEIDAEVEGDARFPEFDRSRFVVAWSEPHPADARHAYAFRFVTYDRRPG